MKPLKIMVKIIVSLLCMLAVYGLGSGQLSSRLFSWWLGSERGELETGSFADAGERFELPEPADYAEGSRFVQIGSMRIPMNTSYVSGGNVGSARRERKHDMRRRGYQHLADESTAEEEWTLGDRMSFDLFFGKDHEVVCVLYKAQSNEGRVLVTETSFSRNDLVHGGIRRDDFLSDELPNRKIPSHDLAGWSDLIAGEARLAMGERPGGDGMAVASHPSVDLRDVSSEASRVLREQGYEVTEMDADVQELDAPVLIGRNGRNQVEVSLTAGNRGTRMFYRFSRNTPEP